MSLNDSVLKGTFEQMEDLGICSLEMWLLCNYNKLSKLAKTHWSIFFHATNTTSLYGYVDEIMIDRKIHNYISNYFENILKSKFNSIMIRNKQNMMKKIELLVNFVFRIFRVIKSCQTLFFVTKL